jgi:hypothetical protein
MNQYIYKHKTEKASLYIHATDIKEANKLMEKIATLKSEWQLYGHFKVGAE